MHQRHVAAAMAGLWLGVTAVGAAQQAGTGRWIRPGYDKELAPERLRANVERMLKQDAAAQPPAEAVLFVGSATIAGWDIPRYFPEYKTIKRGMGGSLASEATYWADRLVTNSSPSTVVFYSGDNDLGYGMTAEMVANDVAAFVRKIPRGTSRHPHRDFLDPSKHRPLGGPPGGLRRERPHSCIRLEEP